MDKQELSRMYLEEHLTMEQIGRVVGLTRQGVCHWVKKHGIDVGKAERFKVICDVCGKEFELTRKRFTKSIKHFCGMGCYTSYLRNPSYRQSRTGQRIARSVLGQSLQRELRSGEVVHHRDGDDTNNSLGNLQLFGSHSEHIAFHHKLRQDTRHVLK